MATRKALSKKIRFEVFKRDSFSCQYCGANPPDVILEVDHITPVALGGDNGMDNLITSCFPCNRGKAANSLTSVPVGLQERAAMVKESEAQIAAYSLIMRDKRDRIERECWEVAEELIPGCSDSGLNQSMFNSIRMFLDRLPVCDLLEAAEIASLKYKAKNRKFLYFCGVCWRMIRENERG